MIEMTITNVDRNSYTRSTPNTTNITITDTNYNLFLKRKDVI